MNLMYFTKINIFLLALVFFLPFNSYAENIGSSTEEQRSQCFEILKENMAEAGIFELPLGTLNKMSYKDLEPRFSTANKLLSNFEIQLDVPLFEMRTYDFGEKSGYVYPPKIPLPLFTKSDDSKSLAGEFSVSEEFIIDTKSGKRFFMGCWFAFLETDDLSKITNESYLYDFNNISLLKIPKDESYKALFGTSIGFDYEDNFLLEWRNIVVYPKFTQNEYFNRYDVSEAHPANKVVSFNILKFFLQNLIILEEYDESTSLLNTKYLINKGGESVEVDPPKELITIKPEGINEFFPLTEYYQAIEDKFPEFASHLSIMGTLKYDTFKRLVSDKIAGKIGESSDKLLGVVTDYRSLVKYSRNKENFKKEGVDLSDPEKDELLLQVQDTDSVIEQIEKEKKIETLKKWGKVGLVGSGFVVIVYSIIFFLKKKIIKIG